MAILYSMGDAGINPGGQAFSVLAITVQSDVIFFFKNSDGIFLTVALAEVDQSTNSHSYNALRVKLFLIGLCAMVEAGGIFFYNQIT